MLIHPVERQYTLAYLFLGLGARAQYWYNPQGVN